MANADRAQAAARLRHDLGKYIRLSAPETPESDTAALRERLRADVLATRRTADETRGAADVFEEWLREDGHAFPTDGPLGVRVASIGQAIGEIRGLAGRLDALDRAALDRLDGLTRVVAQECRDLAREAKS
jgi:hypothetical protein